MSHSLLSRIWGLRRPRRLASAVLRRLGLSHYLTIRTSGIRLRFFPAVWTAMLWEQPDFFRRDTDLLRRWLRPGDILVDCGANVGLLAIVGAQQVGPTGRVYAIEAHPKIFRFLQSNVGLNGATNITLVHAAVGEKEGTIAFSDRPADDGNHILPQGSGISTAMKPLDALLPAGTPMRLLKLDVEGYEKFVVEGARALLPFVEAIYFESSQVLFDRYGYTCEDMFRPLRANGFTLFRLNDDRSITRIAADYVSREIENLIAARDVECFARATGYEVR
jgi:FkbM family methyltransferase